MPRYNDISMGGYKLSGLTSGTATLVAGTVTISTSKVTATSKILLMKTSHGGTSGELAVTTRTAATSFVVTSSSGADTSTFEWAIIG